MLWGFFARSADEIAYVLFATHSILYIKTKCKSKWSLGETLSVYQSFMLWHVVLKPLSLMRLKTFEYRVW